MPYAFGMKGMPLNPSSRGLGGGMSSNPVVGRGVGGLPVRAPSYIAPKWEAYDGSVENEFIIGAPYSIPVVSEVRNAIFSLGSDRVGVPVSNSGVLGIAVYSLSGDTPVFVEFHTFSVTQTSMRDFTCMQLSRDSAVVTSCYYNGSSYQQLVRYVYNDGGVIKSSSGDFDTLGGSETNSNLVRISDTKFIVTGQGSGNPNATKFCEIVNNQIVARRSLSTSYGSGKNALYDPVSGKVLAFYVSQGALYVVSAPVDLATNDVGTKTNSPTYAGAMHPVNDDTTQYTLGPVWVEQHADNVFLVSAYLIMRYWNGVDWVVGSHTGLLRKVTLSADRATIASVVPFGVFSDSETAHWTDGGVYVPIIKTATPNTYVMLYNDWSGAIRARIVALDAEGAGSVAFGTVYVVGSTMGKILGCTALLKESRLALFYNLRLRTMVLK